MFRFPDVYAVGVAVAPVPDQRLYDTIYQERYMGLPEENAAGYKIGSPINFADGLKGKLLIVHGSGDDNVHYQGTERLINRLVELGKPFDVMVYPNRTHAIAEGPGTTPHVYHLIARYFLEHLRPGGGVNIRRLPRKMAAPMALARTMTVEIFNANTTGLPTRMIGRTDSTTKSSVIVKPDTEAALSQPGAVGLSQRDSEHHQVGQGIEDRRRVPEQLEGLLLADPDEADDAERERDRADEQDGIHGRLIAGMQAREPRRQQAIPSGNHRYAGVAREHHARLRYADAQQDEDGHRRDGGRGSQRPEAHAQHLWDGSDEIDRLDRHECEHRARPEDEHHRDDRCRQRLRIGQSCAPDSCTRPHELPRTRSPPSAPKPIFAAMFRLKIDKTGIVVASG